MKSLNESLQQISPILQQVEEFRLEKLAEYRKRWYWLLIPFGVLLLAIWGYIINTEGSVILANFGLLIALCVGGYIYFESIKRSLKEYRSEFKKLALKKLVKEIHPSISYNPLKFIDEQDFLASCLFRKQEMNYRGQDLFEGTINNTKTSFSELTIRIAGNNSKEIFNGLFFVLETTQHLAQQLTILPKHAEIYFKDLNESKHIKKTVSEIIKQERLVSMIEQQDFDQLFNVYSVEQKDSQQILSSSMLSAISTFQDKLKADIYLSFIGPKLYLAINTSNNYFEIDPKESVLEQSSFLKIHEELALCFSLIEDLTARINGFE